jgi:hypoxia up-regulated 1
MIRFNTIFLAFFICITSNIFTVDSLAVMSIDLGTEFMKIAIVKPGIPMEIVLNKWVFFFVEYIVDFIIICYF